MLASVALRTSIGLGAVQLQQVEGVKKRDRLVASPPQDIKSGKPALLAAHDLPVDQARSHLEVVHRLNH